MNNVTLAQLKKDIRFQSDEENSEFIADDDLVRIINLSAAELWDKLVSAYDEDYYQKTASISVVANKDAYALPADFFKLVGVDVNLNPSGTEKYSLQKYNWNDRNRHHTSISSVVNGGIFAYRLISNNIKLIPMPTSAKTIQLSYIPTSKKLTLDIDFIDGINGWEEYIIYDCSIRIMTKSESDPGPLMVKLREINERIDSMKHNRDADSTETVSYSSGISQGHDWVGN